MTLAQLIVLTLQSSIVVVAFTIGLGTAPHELTHLLHRPGQLVRSLVSMNLVMLAIAVMIALLFPLPRPTLVVLVTLALSPVPPVLPKKLMRAGGGHDYVMALLFSASVFAIAWIPLASEALDRIFPAYIDIPPAAVAKLVSLSVLGPTLAGVVARLLAPKLALRIAEPLGKVATLLLLAGLALVLAKAAPTMLGLLGDGTLLAIVAFIVLGLVAGHLLGGPMPGDRSALALATASRHPGVAIGIAQLIFPSEKLIAATVLLYLITSLVVTMPYLRWRMRAPGPVSPRPT